MNKSITYGELREFLLELGYEDKSGEYLIFEHPRAASAVVTLALHEWDELVLDRDLVAVRGVLDLSGVLDRERFDHWICDLTGSRAATG